MGKKGGVDFRKDQGLDLEHDTYIWDAREKISKLKYTVINWMYQTGG